MSTKYFVENMNIPIYETALPFFHQNVWAQLYGQNILKWPKILTAKWCCHAGKALLATILDNGDENELDNVQVSICFFLFITPKAKLSM